MLCLARRIIGQLLSGARLHRWHYEDGIPFARCRKYRTRLSALLIPIGNLYLRLQGARVEVLSRTEWLAWELKVAAALGRTFVSVTAEQGLETAVAPGKSLCEILRDELPMEDRFRAIRLASVSLRQLHSVQVISDQGGTVPLSHGDATCRNVIVDLEKNIATWIDFDTRHRAQLSAPERHADDLRALVFSTAVDAPPRVLDGLANCVLEAYGDPDVISLLQKTLAAQRCPLVAELAQAPLDRTLFLQTRSRILNFNSRSDNGPAGERRSAGCVRPSSFDIP